MKNKFNILFLLLGTFIFACDDDDAVFTGPSSLIVAGTHGVTPGDVEEYTLRDINNPESYTWAVEGPGEIVGSSTGNTVTVEFHSVGEVILTVTNGEDNGKVVIGVNNVEPAVTTTLNGTGVLREGVADTVFFEFDSPLSKDPTISMVTDSTEFNGGDPIVSGTLGELIKVDAQNYYAIYTAGAEEGISEGFLPQLIATEIYGADTIDSVYVQLYEVDNTDPVANLSYSQLVVNDSTEVTVTATFSEPINYANLEDSAIYISFSGAGVEAASDTLQPTDDPLVYTYQYVVNGEGSGTVDIDISNAVDLAGNPLAVVNNANELKVDNMAPLLAIVTASDDGDYATIQMVSNEDGEGMYLILEGGDDAPTTTEEFMEVEESVSSGSVELMANNGKKVIELLATGDYDVYFLAQDEAGNYSQISSVNLVMD